MRLKILNHSDRFEIVARLYYENTNYLAPGKDDPRRDSSSKENVVRFSEWRSSEAFNDAVTDIACQCAMLEQIDTWSSIAPELNMDNYDEDEVSELNDMMKQIAALF